MNDLGRPSAWDGIRFGVSQPVRRVEDEALLRGEGSYTDDVDLDGQVHAHVVRSQHAHGLIKAIDLAPALAMPGVLGAWTGKDLAIYGTLKCPMAQPNRDGAAIRIPKRHALAIGKVTFVGDAIAFVVAKSALQARDAAEAVAVDIEPLPAVTDAEAALKPGAPQLFAEIPGNLQTDFHAGDAAKTAAAFARAAHVTRLEIDNNRIVVAALEPRAAIAEFDKRKGKFTLHVPSQGAFGLRNNFAAFMGVQPEQMRILTGHVGGSFGMKGAVFPEYVCILHAAKELGKPVKICNDRSVSFLSDHHGRGSKVVAELALDKAGKFLAARFTGIANLGGYLTSVGPFMQTRNILTNSASLYATPLIEVMTKCVMTNTVPVAAYRGAGRPEGNYYMERLVDAAARELGVSSLKLRKLNNIKPAALPFKAASGLSYDSGDFPGLLADTLDAADVKGFAKRKRISAKRGFLRGLGIAQFLESTAGKGKELGGIRFDADGGVTMVSGTLDYGQGHRTAFAQVLHEKLGIPFEKFRLLQGDSDELIIGGGTGGSRSGMVGSAALLAAADIVIANGRKIAAHILETGEGDIEFSHGRFKIAGTDRGIGILDLAARLARGVKLPAGLPQKLDVDHAFDGVPEAFPNGCHICEVEIDRDTGAVRVDRYSTVNDFGTLLNPMIVAGQLHGGVVQGIGQALMEHAVFDGDGQLLSGSFMDYAMPRAADVPMIGFASRPDPAKTNPLGVKGCGEAGCAGSLPAVTNAVVDALAEFGVTHINMPAEPEKIWRIINGGKS